MQLRFTDVSNTSHSLNVSPGTVAAVTSDNLTLTPNDGAAPKTFALTQNTRIRQAGGLPWAGGQGAPSDPHVGDRVVVVTLDTASDARAVLIGGAHGFAPRRNWSAH